MLGSRMQRVRARESDLGPEERRVVAAAPIESATTATARTISICDQRLHDL